jgi:hypothetical protein
MYVVSPRGISNPVCCDSCSVKTSAALGSLLSHPFLVLPQSEEAGAVALARGGGGVSEVRSIGGVGGEAVVLCEAVEDAALRGRASVRAGRGLEEARSFDVAGWAMWSVSRTSAGVGDEARGVFCAGRVRDTHN